MALKFRRGTTAQKSGSLAFGEPYVNTTLGTLQIGGESTDITLSAVGTGSNLLINDITASGNLLVNGNATIDGNLTLGGAITIGDNSSDVVNVVASLSSSLIPETSNTYNLGSAAKFWKEIYVSTGSIKFVDNAGNVVSTLSSNASGDFNIDGEFSASSITGIGNVATYSSSVSSRLVAAESFSSSLDSTFATDASVTSLSSSVKAVTDTFATSASVASATATSISSLSSSVKAVTDTFATSASVASATATSISTLSGSVFTTYAKLAGANTFTANQIVSGSITATGDVVAYSTSDKRHKNNIVNITDALAKVTKLNGVTWEWNEDVDDATKETPKTGLIAQEVQEVLPEVVKERGDGFLALDYSKTIGLLVEAIKEQQTQIHSLTLEIEKLKKNNSL